MAGNFKRIKDHKDRNYHALFNNGDTLRYTYDPNKPILPLEYPEITDVSITPYCAANCSYCYTSAVKESSHHENVVEKILEVYGEMSLNNRPFQVALGGEGEPTSHPDFPEVLKTFYDLDIMPNYTTNGMHLSDEVLEATRIYAGGAAISCHPHLEKLWRRKIPVLAEVTRLCLHIIVGEPGSSDKFWEIYDSTEGVEYYVCLPYQASGRAKSMDTEDEWFKFFNELEKRGVKDVPLGALFYPFFLEHPEIPKSIGAELYEPEVMSGYRILDDSYKLLRKSSYDLSPKFGRNFQDLKPLEMIK